MKERFPFLKKLGPALARIGGVLEDRALYFALAGIWNFPLGEQVLGTIAAIDTFLGVLLGISSAQYNQANAQN